MCFFLERGGQPAADGAQQRQSGNRHHQLFGKGGEQAGDDSAKQANDHVQRAARHCGGVTPLRVGVRFGAHADGGRDGAEVQGKRS